MKLPKVFRPELEVECSNMIVFLLIAIWAHIKIGIKKGTVKVLVIDKNKGKFSAGEHVFYAIPKFFFKKARPEDADV